MDKETERTFLELMARALETLPFDLKMLAEATADVELELPAREFAAAAVIHALNAKDSRTEPILRYSDDVVLVRLAMKRIATEGGADAASFTERFADNFAALDTELGLFRAVLGDAIVDWLDGRWPFLKKANFNKKPATKFAEDDALGTALYDDVSQFATDYPIAEGSLASRLKQSQLIVDHLQRKKLEVDKMKTSYH